MVSFPLEGSFKEWPSEHSEGYNCMKINEWEKFFKEETDKTSIYTEKYDYDQCRAALRWAQFCGAKSISLRVGKNSTGLTVEINFCFASENDFNLFVNELDEMVEYIMYY